MKEKLIQHGKKIAKYALIGLSAFLLLIIFLFILFIANPIQGNYSGHLLNLAPQSSDVVIYNKNLPLAWEKLQKIIPLREIKRSPRFSLLKKEPIYQEVMREIDKIREQEKQLGISILEEEHLWHLVGEEFFLAFKWEERSPKTPAVLFATKVSFLIESVEGIAQYLVPSLLEQSKSEQGILSLVLPDGTLFYFCRHRDVLLASNNQKYLISALSLRTSSSASFLKKAQDLDSHLIEGASSGNVQIYGDIALLREKKTFSPNLLPEALFGIEQFVDPALVEKAILELQFDEQLKVELFAKHSDGAKVNLYHNTLFTQTYSSLDSEKLLPQDVYFTGSIQTVPPMLWDNLSQNLPPGQRQNFQKFLSGVNQRYQEENFLENNFIQKLSGSISFALMRVDYLRENMTPLDPYPALGIFLHSKEAPLLLEKLRETIEKELLENPEIKVELVPSNYGGLDYFAIDLKGFDFTGGALQPAIAQVGNYLVFTTQKSFFLNLQDVQDKFKKSLEKNFFYGIVCEQFEGMTSLTNSLSNQRDKNTSEIIYPKNHLFLDSDGILKYIDDFKDTWAKEYALNATIQNPYGKSKEAYEKEFLDDINSRLELAKIFRLYAGLGIEQKLEGIQAKAVFYLDIR